MGWGGEATSGRVLGRIDGFGGVLGWSRAAASRDGVGRTASEGSGVGAQPTHHAVNPRVQSRKEELDTVAASMPWNVRSRRVVLSRRSRIRG